MENADYKIGDYVVRLNEEHLGISVNQVCRIYEFGRNNQPRLEGQYIKDGSHALRNIRRAFRHEIPNYKPNYEIYY